MVVYVVVDGDQFVNQCCEGVEGDKGLFLREVQLFNKEDCQDFLNVVIVKMFLEFYKEDYKEWMRLLQ